MKTDERLVEEKSKSDLLINRPIRIRRNPMNNIGYFLLLIGLILFLFATITSSHIPAFIGMALTFWGALLTYIKPTQFVSKKIMDSIIPDLLSNINRFVNGRKFNGTPIFFPLGNLERIENVVLCIPESDRDPLPSLQQLSMDDPFIKNPPAIKLRPIGLRLSKLMEDSFQIESSPVNSSGLKKNLHEILIEDLEITESFEMKATGSIIQVEIGKTIFDEIVKEFINDFHYYTQNPIVSAIACILARLNKSPIIIEKIRKHLNLTQITYRIENYNDNSI
jgi:hypothetical protein